MEATVEIAQGILRGSSDGTVASFRGVPYAAAPFGELRMRPPGPAPTWDGIRDVTVNGPTVPKSPYPPHWDALLDEPHIDGAECLNLNVWAPAELGGSHPVFVWIHGGAFIYGSGIVAQYDGSAFARDGVVCVTINYRLGADGFLDTGDEYTNIGLRDQSAALEWVRDNIAAFGGDPARVTIGGESAGAMSVTHLLANPPAPGLFHRAIMQSGAGHHAITHEEARHVSAELGDRLGVEPSRDAIAAVPIADLQAVEEAISIELQTMPDPEKWGSVAANQMAFEPVIDGDTVPALPIERISAGAGAEIDVLIGTNTDENRLFLVPDGAISHIDDTMLELAIAGFGLPVQETLETYRAARPSATPGDLLASISTDWMFRIPAVRLAEARDTAAGGTYFYEFAWRSTAFGGALGACHFLEIPFVFDTLAEPSSAPLTGEGAPQALADEVHGAWVRFIRDGDPGWPAYSSDTRTTMRFDTDSALVDDVGAAERRLWAEIR